MTTEEIIKLQQEAVASGLNPANPQEIDDYVARRMQEIKAEAEKPVAKPVAKKKTTKKKASKKS